MEILTNPEIREQAYVFARNQFVFPNTRLSTDHVSGWKSVENCCQLAELDSAITTTQMRHFATTVFAGLELSNDERNNFMNTWATQRQ